MSVSKNVDGFDVSYKDGQHHFARVYLNKKLVGDFIAHINVKGGFSDLHVCAIDGRDQVFWGNPSLNHIPVTQRHTYAIIRKGDQIKMESDGNHKIEVNPWPADVDSRMPCYVAIAIHKGKTARVYSWDVKE